jgi:acetyltransferase
MTERPHDIERLNLPASDADCRSLAQLLVDAVESGAAVSFLAPLTVARAEAWWRSMLSAADPRAVVLVARDADGIVGTVQFHPAWAPNQPHRAEIAKLLVHRRSRRFGLGTRLMLAIEDEARRAGFGLLTLDAKRGEAAEQLYRRLGWAHAGTIPRFAFDSDGTPHDAVIFYKDLTSVGRAGRRAERSEPILPSRDLDETRAFYARLGFTAWFGRSPWDYEIMSRGHLVLHFFTKSTLRPGENDSSCYCRVKDADQYYQQLIGLKLPAEGIPRLTAPADQPWGMREFTVVDPSGNLLRVGHDLWEAYIPKEP